MLTRHALGFRGVGHCDMLTAVQLLTWQRLREGGMPCETAQALSEWCPRFWPFGGAKC